MVTNTESLKLQISAAENVIYSAHEISRASQDMEPPTSNELQRSFS